MSDQSSGNSLRQWFSNPPKLPPVPKLSSLSSSLSDVFSPNGILSFSNDSAPKSQGQDSPSVPTSAAAASATTSAASSRQNSAASRRTQSPKPAELNRSAASSPAPDLHSSSPPITPGSSHAPQGRLPQGRVFGNDDTGSLNSAHNSASNSASNSAHPSPTSSPAPHPMSKASSVGSSLLWPISGAAGAAAKPAADKGKEKNRESTIAKDNPLELLDDSKVTREHWQPDSGSEKCANQECQKPLYGNLFQKKSHCRRCGRLYCDSCCNFQIRLDVNANHDPENGYWCRVCKQCFVARKGYSQEFGTTRNHTKLLKKLRGNNNEKQGLEASRLDMRLEKLQKIFADDSLSTAAKREKEKTIIAWVDDSKVLNCPTCSRPFSLLTNRKHHCRFCGEVTCSYEECSNMVILSRDSDRDQVRACTKCISMLTRNRKKEEQKQAAPHPIIRYYEEVKKTQAKLEELIPKFNEELTIFNAATDDRPKRASFENATSLRQTILQQFQYLEALAKKIAGLPTPDPNSAAQRVQNNILIAVNNYLQSHMFTLALLPNSWKSSGTADGKKGAGDRNSVAESSSQGKRQTEKPSKAKSPAQPEPKKVLTEAEKKKTRETIEVLFEQKAQIDAFITKFKSEGQVEEVSTLVASKKEIEAEIKRLQSMM